MAIEKMLPAVQFSIMEGPSKFDLMTSLFDGKVVKITCDVNLIGCTTQNPQTSASFKIYPKLNVIFQYGGPEDGSRERWFGEIDFVDQNYQKVRRKFYFDTKTRKGYVRPV